MRGLILVIAFVWAGLVSMIPTAASGAEPSYVVAASGSASDHTCAITDAGGVRCWGWNRYGQLGDGTLIDRPVPVDVAGLNEPIEMVAVGRRHTCALTSGGAVRCWGDNSSGQLGDGGSCGMRCLAPVQVSGLSSGAAAIAAGYVHSCALLDGGSVRCWGNNLHGQIGNGLVGSPHTTPVNVWALNNVANVVAGDWHTCAVTQPGSAKCWGENIHGQLGTGTAHANIPQPASVVGLSGVSLIAAGAMHSCALNSDGSVRCWGDNPSGQIGNGAAGGMETEPSPVVGITNAESLATGNRHTCAAGPSGTACWGSNASGQLGDGGACMTPCVSPAEVFGLPSEAELTAGEGHTCALVGSDVYCWGANDLGQLGRGTAGGSGDVPALVGPAGGPTPMPVGGMARLARPVERSSGGRAGWALAIGLAVLICSGLAVSYWRRGRGRHLV